MDTATLPSESLLLYYSYCCRPKCKRGALINDSKKDNLF